MYSEINLQLILSLKSLLIMVVTLVYVVNYIGGKNFFLIFMATTNALYCQTISKSMQYKLMR